MAPRAAAGPVRTVRWPAELRAQFLRHVIGVHAVANDQRSNEDDQLGAAGALVRVREDIAEHRDLVEKWDALTVAVAISLMRPASRTVCPLATAIELFTLR